MPSPTVTLQMVGADEDAPRIPGVKINPPISKTEAAERSGAGRARSTAERSSSFADR